MHDTDRDSDTIIPTELGLLISLSRHWNLRQLKWKI